MLSVAVVQELYHAGTGEGTARAVPSRGAAALNDGHLPQCLWFRGQRQGGNISPTLCLWERWRAGVAERFLLLCGHCEAIYKHASSVSGVPDVPVLQACGFRAGGGVCIWCSMP